MQITDIGILISGSLFLKSFVLALTTGGNATAADGMLQWVANFSAASQQFLQSLNAALEGILRLAWVTLLVVGVIVYATHLSRKLGRDFIIGGILMAIVVQFVLPYIATLA